MDKLVADGRKVTISNDGATIMRLLEIEHPAAKTLVDISMSQVRCHLLTTTGFSSASLSLTWIMLTLQYHYYALYSSLIFTHERMPKLETEQHPLSC